MPPDEDAPEEIVWQGKFVTAKKRGRWEYVSRSRGIRAAVILAIDEGQVLLVEQYRVPLGKRCLGRSNGIIDPILLLIDLCFGSATNFDNGDFA